MGYFNAQENKRRAIRRAELAGWRNARQTKEEYMEDIQKSSVAFRGTRTPCSCHLCTAVDPRRQSLLDCILSQEVEADLLFIEKAAELNRVNRAQIRRLTGL